MDEKEAEARPVMGTIFLVSMKVIHIKAYRLHEVEVHWNQSWPLVEHKKTKKTQ